MQTLLTLQRCLKSAQVQVSRAMPGRGKPDASQGRKFHLVYAVTGH